MTTVRTAVVTKRNHYTKQQGVLPLKLCFEAQQHTYPDIDSAYVSHARFGFWHVSQLQNILANAMLMHALEHPWLEPELYLQSVILLQNNAFQATVLLLKGKMSSSKAPTRPYLKKRLQRGVQIQIPTLLTCCIKGMVSSHQCQPHKLAKCRGRVMLQASAAIRHQMSLCKASSGTIRFITHCSAIPVPETDFGVCYGLGLIPDTNCDAIGVTIGICY